MISEIIGIVASLGGLAGAFLYVVHRMLNTERIKAFDQTVTQLASTNNEAQLSAAILLRRFLTQRNWRGKKPLLYDEAINVMSALLRTLPTSVFQKTLCDGLAYVDHKDGLSLKDFQNTNLQHIYLGSKVRRILCYKTDFYLADLSYSLLENIDGEGIIFYDAILLSATMKNCSFRNANFRGADLTKVCFKNVCLYNADFSDAINLPDEIADKLNDKGIYVDSQNFTSPAFEKTKKVFLSVPGIMTKQDLYVVESYKSALKGYNLDYKDYVRDQYPQYGQLNNIRREMSKCDGIIAFGFKQLEISAGKYRENSKEEADYSGRWLTTPWSEIEVGMALALGLPVLLVHDPEIMEGVFDPVLSEYFVGKITTDIDTKTKICSNKTFDNWYKIL